MALNPVHLRHPHDAQWEFVPVPDEESDKQPEAGPIQVRSAADFDLERLLASGDQSSINRYILNIGAQTAIKLREQINRLEDRNVALQQQVQGQNEQIQKTAAAAIDAANTRAEQEARKQEDEIRLTLVTGSTTLGGFLGSSVLGGLVGLFALTASLSWFPKRQSLIPYGVSENDLLEYQLAHPDVTREMALRKMLFDRSITRALAQPGVRQVADGPNGEIILTVRFSRETVTLCPITDERISSYQQTHPGTTKEEAIREVASTQDSWFSSKLQCPEHELFELDGGPTY
jgi:hypothetical protein